MGLLSRVARKGIEKTEDVFADVAVRTYRAPVRGHTLEMDVTQAKTGGGRSRHPAVEWRLVPETGYEDTVNLSPKDRVTIGRESSRLVEKMLKLDAKQYRPSAYVFSPTTESRTKLYKGMLSRGASDYRFEPVSGEPIGARMGQLKQGIEGLWNAQPHVSLSNRIGAVKDGVSSLMLPPAEYYQAVYSPSVIKELLQGAAINAPIAGLGAAALGYGR